MGCLSPRMMFEELKKSANRYKKKFVPLILVMLSLSMTRLFYMVFFSRTLSVASSMKNAVGMPKADGGMNWLMFELLWRDFFR